MLWHFTDFENFRFWFIGDSKCADIWAAFEFMLTITHIGDCSSKHLTKKINNGKDIKLDLYNSNTDNQTRNLRQQGKIPLRCVRKPLKCLIWFDQSVRNHDDGKIWISLGKAWILMIELQGLEQEMLAHIKTQSKKRLLSFCWTVIFYNIWCSVSSQTIIHLLLLAFPVILTTCLIWRSFLKYRARSEQ